MLYCEITDPRLADVSVTDVTVTTDLGAAKVYYYIWGKHPQSTVEAGFNSAKGYIKKKMAATVRLKKIPEISFCYDRAMGNAERVDQLMRGIENDRLPRNGDVPKDR